MFNNWIYSEHETEGRVSEKKKKLHWVHNIESIMHAKELLNRTLYNITFP